MKVPRRTALRRVASLVAVMVVATLAVMGVTSTVAMAAGAMASATSHEATTEDGAKVSVGAPQGALPDGATLHVDPVTSNEDVQAVTDELDEAEVSYDGFAAFDVYFTDADGNEVEPTEAVSVRFELPEGAVPEDAEDLAVHHLAEAEDGTVAEVEAVADDADATEGTVAVQDDATVDAEFTVESFSVFTFSWGSDSDEDNASAAVDESSLDYEAGVSRSSTSRAAEGSTVFLSEDFMGATLNNEDAWTWMGDSVGLTAADRGEAHYVSSQVNSDRYIGSQHGDGYLQLTDASEGQTGTVLYDVPVPTEYGLDISFYQWQFDHAYHGYDADGIGFFLAAGNFTLNENTKGPVGPNYGGALGYSAIKDENLSYETKSGLANGILGIGLDVFGNFSAENQVGGYNTRVDGDSQTEHTYSVTVRGAGEQDEQGEWTHGYDVIQREQLTGNRQDWLLTGAPEQTRHEMNVSSEDDDNATLVRIVITPKDENGDQTLTVTLTRNNGSSYSPISNLKLETPLPDTVKFGFSASTGQGTNVHFIRGLEIASVDPVESGINLVKEINRTDYQGTNKTIFQAGDVVPYMFTVTNTGGNTLYNVHINDPHVSNAATRDGQSSVTLDPGETVVFYGSLTLTNEMIGDSTQFTNTATVEGTDGSGGTVTDEDSEIITTVPQEEIDPPVISKKIGDNNDGTYTLALDVIGNSNEGVIEGGGEPLDIVLVLDASGSMDGSKMRSLKQAAKSFVGATAAANNGLSQDSQSRIAIVSFAYTAEVNKQIDYVTSANKTSFENAIDNLSANGSTAADYGLERAQSILNSNKRNDARQVVVFFTDGVPNHSGSSFDNVVASDAVNTAHDMKESGVTIYAVGVSSDANASLTDDDGFNEFLNGVSSNYPSAKAQGSNGGWFGYGAYYNTTFGDRANGDYYYAVKDASAIEGIFDDIFEDINVGTSYSGVTIVDQLSEYAEITDAITYEDASDEAGFHRVTEGVSLKVERPNGEGWQEVEENVPYTAYYKLSDSADSTGTIKVVFGADYKLKKDYKYTVEFDVKPTDKASEDYASNVADGGNGYGDTVGEEGTDLYQKVTSSLQPGFHSNHDAWVEYTAYDKPQEPVYYDHPVLQVKTLTVTGKLAVTKTLDGHALEPNMFGFTVTPVAPIDESSSAKESADFAGFVWDDGTQDHAISFNNGTHEGAANDKVTIRDGNTLVIDPSDAGESGKTYAYEYRESDGLLSGITDVKNGQITFDSNVYRVEVKVENTTDEGLRATITKYVEDESVENGWRQLDQLSLSQKNPAGDKTISIDFANKYNGYGLNIYKFIWNDKNKDGVVDEPDEVVGPRSGATFVLTPVEPSGNSLGSVETDDKGSADFTGLAEGVVYKVEETRVPSGYDLAAPRYIRIDDGKAYMVEQNENGEWVHVVVNGKDSELPTVSDNDSIFQIKIGNKETPDLPSSGSNGTLLMMSTGVAVVLLAGAYLSKRFGRHRN
ncbi:VWA domain-containing protein [Thermophilibacter provencensis]|uniref:DUF7604 domain-containing protein n=1 Tax=Thermophilibacter provencensis TaxID=1852386 RepID=UPI002942FDA9|nr:VWA domain-containing protein [Thermophilibacter provencensis]